jgi:hypothetical protein
LPSFLALGALVPWAFAWALAQTQKRGAWSALGHPATFSDYGTSDEGVGTFVTLALNCSSPFQRLLLNFSPTLAIAMTENSPPKVQTSDAATGKDRKARKRETDRVAQREHRRRQKVYVRQLQEAVQDLSARQTRDERLDYLVADRARLQELCNSLTSKLERVKQIASSAEPILQDEAKAEVDKGETQSQRPGMLPPTEMKAAGREEVLAQVSEDRRSSECYPKGTPDALAITPNSHVQRTV